MLASGIVRIKENVLFDYIRFASVDIKCATHAKGELLFAAIPEYVHSYFLLFFLLFVGDVDCFLHIIMDEWWYFDILQNNLRFQRTTEEY